MRRSWLIWLIFCMGSIAALAAMGWITHSVLDLDARMRHDNQLEENIRLSLWRMDALVNPLILQESGRSFVDEQMVDLAAIKPDADTNPAMDDARFLARFQIDCSGNWRVSGSGDPRVVRLLKSTTPTVASLGLCEADELLNDMSLNGGNQAITANQDNNRNNQRIIINGGAQNPGQIQNNGFVNQNNDATNRRPDNSFANDATQNPQSNSFAMANPEASNRINGLNTKTFNEYEARRQSQNFSQLANVAYRNTNNDNVSQIREGPVAAKWEGAQLILARRVWVNQKTAAQGAILNWQEIKGNLLASICDLLPNADLIPIANEQDPQTLQHRLATLPALLIPGDIIVQRDADFTPMRMVLLVAWIFMAIGTLAVSGLLWGTLTLSRRREDFVSAVTHELRTPITSVSMYAEMLQAGMASDESKRTQYLGTLRAEAHRLGRLIENVLSFSRIERGKIARKIEKMDLATTLEPIKARLEARANQADLSIEWSIPSGLAALADSSAIEQILFNLVDNAAKYAGDAQDKRILIEGNQTDGAVELRIRDFGPGIPDGTKLFKPFSKSAKDAANSAPGVGLGLALSRRLARGMKGDLRHDANVKPGACFVVKLKM